MSGELINGVHRLLGRLPDVGRPDLNLAHNLVTGELVVIALPLLKTQAIRDDLQQEGEVFQGVTSRNVHAVIDWDCEQGFIAWEYISGWPLRAAMQRGAPPDLGWVLSLLYGVASGLAALHTRGAVYRGLHPGRIVVMRDGGAKLMTTASAVLTNRARTIEIGPPHDTPIHYLAPEQIEGSIDARSDIYSLAAVGYELLTGERMFASTDPVTLAVQILKTDAPPPSAIRPDVPPELDDLFMHCLSRDPNERPSSFGTVLTHLRKLAEGYEDHEPQIGSVRSQRVVFSLLLTGGPIEVSETTPAPLPASLPSESADPGPQSGAKPTPVPSEVDRGAGLAANVGEATLIDELVTWELRCASGETFPLKGNGVLVGRKDANGRAPEIDLSSLDSQHVISREHAYIELKDGAWSCHDLGARNGSWLNGRRLASREVVPLADGDVLRFASVEMVLRRVAAG